MHLQIGNSTASSTWLSGAHLWRRRRNAGKMLPLRGWNAVPMFLRLVPLFIVPLVCSGCIVPKTTGEAFKAEYISHIIIGKTTKADIVARFGAPPSKFSPDHEGDETWVWSYELTGGGGPLLSYKGAQLQRLRVSFDDDVVVDCMFSTSVAEATVCGTENIALTGG